MFHLLHIEWLKLKNYRTFWILSILFVISIFGVNYLAHEILSNDMMKNPAMTFIIGGPPFQFPQVWQSVAWVSGLILIIPGLLIVISITNEYSFKTHRQNIIDGMSRTQFILVKMLLALIISIISTLLVFITTIGFGLAEGGSTLSFNGLNFIGYFFIQALNYSFVAILISLLLKRSGVSIGVYFLYAVIIENMLAGILNKYTNHVGYYLPLRSANALIPFPFFRTLTRQLLYRPETMYLLLTVSIYMLFYFFFSKRKFETSDL
jgi:ABC-2 type transport system permease protein